MMSTQGSAIDKNAIARRAYELYLARGGEDGHDLEDWLRAENELRREVPSAPTAVPVTTPTTKPHVTAPRTTKGKSSKR
jgi:hypothetical protein